MIWIAFGAYLQAPSIARQVGRETMEKYYSLYVSSWFMYATIVSLASSCVTLVSSIYYHVSSIPYLIRFGNLSLWRYILSLYAGAIILSLILGGIMVLLTSLLFSYNGLGVEVHPQLASIAALPGAISVVGLFIASLSLFLSLLSTKILRLSSTRMISFVPLVIAMFSYFVYLLLDYRDPLVIYVNPFASSMLLAGEAYYGSELPVSYMVSFSSSEIEKAHPIYLISSTLIWSIALTIANMLLIRKLYIVKIEEERVL